MGSMLPYMAYMDPMGNDMLKTHLMIDCLSDFKWQFPVKLHGVFFAGMAVRVESCLPGHQHDVVKFHIISRISILFRSVWKTGKKARGFQHVSMYPVEKSG